MAVICPTITAYTKNDFDEQIAKVGHIANRIQIDLTDGKFTDKATLALGDVWWPVGVKADIHLMFNNPLETTKVMIKHKPHLVIIHAESDDNFSEVIETCKHHKVKVGLALLPKTGVETISKWLSKIDHVLIFSGNLGYQGGSTADFDLLDKVTDIKRANNTVEIGWDGGVNDQNVAELINGGVDVLNVGGFIQNAQDPEKAIDSLQRIADETGET